MVLWTTIAVVKNTKSAEKNELLKSGKIMPQEIGKTFNVFPFFYWSNITNFFIINLINYDKTENGKRKTENECTNLADVRN